MKRIEYTLWLFVAMCFLCGPAHAQVPTPPPCDNPNANTDRNTNTNYNTDRYTNPHGNPNTYTQRYTDSECHTDTTTNQDTNTDTEEIGPGLYSITMNLRLTDKGIG